MMLKWSEDKYIFLNVLTGSIQRGPSRASLKKPSIMFTIQEPMINAF